MFGFKSLNRLVALKPFLLKIRDGYFLGLAQDSQKGSPCQKCVEYWLKERNVWFENADISELPRRRELIPELLSENSPHIFYEIYQDGTEVRLESIVFPHQDCSCAKFNYLSPKEITKRVNFAFSPIYQLKLTRFGTPDGNQWLATAVGDSQISKKTITAYGVDTDKDAARFRAVDAWMKKSAEADLKERLENGEVIPNEILQTGNVELITKAKSRPSTLDGLGVGSTREEAILDALIHLAKVRTLKKYANAMKSPMLIVGANNWIRTRVPFYVLQKYDIHLFFYPNSTQVWVVGAAAVSRVRTDEKPVFVFSADPTIGAAMDKLFGMLLAAIRPNADEEGMPKFEKAAESNSRNSKLNMWWTHWIYRCPKISLKDVLHLDPYPRSLEAWKNYFKDGQEIVNILAINHPSLPAQLRTIVKLQVETGESFQNIRHIGGIGTWSDFSEALR